MTRRTATPTTSEVPAVLAARIAAMEGSLRNVAAMTSDECDALTATCTAILATLDGTKQSAMTVAQLVLNMRDRLQEMDNAIGCECEEHGCGFVSHRLDEVRARVDTPS